MKAASEEAWALQPAHAVLHQQEGPRHSALCLVSG